ncbi:MAG: glycosyltransferase family 39 protein [Chloroflexaceae bacterium]|nr:glycosyltransferase family 39 protein [Chloroflexaceae bacterium]
MRPFRRIPGSFILLLTFSLMVGLLAYQSPVDDGVAIGWPGDRLFLGSSAGLGQDAVARGDFYADTITDDSPTGRSRWTRQHAVVSLPSIGGGAELEITLLAQGWPEDIVRTPARGASAGVGEGYALVDGTMQPVVTLHADGQVIGTFVPSPSWEAYPVLVPASLRTAPHLTLDIETSAVFTDTLRGADPRAKGLRLAGIRVRGSVPSTGWREGPSLREQFAGLVAQVLPPVWPVVGALVIVAVLLYTLVVRLLRSTSLAFLLASVGVGVAGVGLATTRIWASAGLWGAVWLLMLALLLAWSRVLFRLVRLLAWRYGQGNTLGYGLLAAVLAWVGYAGWKSAMAVRAFLEETQALNVMFPDSLLTVVLLAGLLVLLLAPGREGAPSFATRTIQLLQGERTAPFVLLLLGGIWVGYQTLVIYHLPYVGHADYADNAVVARNLVRGRGWVVDYVTQFYQLYEGTTRPQETWPLLQPVWMAPFLAIFGEQAWAAKIPNLVLTSVLLLLLFAIGATLWDRRVGVTAAVLTVTSHLFFTLTIYTTSDLAFVVLSLGSLFLLIQSQEKRPACSSAFPASFTPSAVLPSLLASLRSRWGALLVGSGGLTGLMMLQKPAGAMVAVGMGVWLLTDAGRKAGTGLSWRCAWRQPSALWALAVGRLVPFALWAGVALLVLSPYLARNMVLFGTPVYSTESYDAWVLGYRGNSEEAWNDIYRVYLPELGGEGVPDRSWLLRWGFDRTFDKLQTQVVAVRDYLLPVWSGLPGPLTGANNHNHGQLLFLGQSERKNLFAPTGAWLSLVGVLVALSFRRRLLSLLALAFTPYTLFLLTYWHANEARYFLLLIPWLALLSSWVLWAACDRLVRIGEAWGSLVGLMLVGAAVVSIIQPSWPIITDKVQREPLVWAPDLAAYAWLRAHTPPDAVVMTRNPWQLNWHTERPAVMIPNTSNCETLAFLSRHYQARYLIFEHLQRVKGDVARLLSPLILDAGAQAGDTRSLPGHCFAGNFTLVYASPTEQDRVLIYAFPEGQR